MSLNATIEDRLAAVDAAVAELRRDRFIHTPAVDWLEQVIGSFQDEPAFEEVLAYGRAIRRGELTVEDVDPWSTPSHGLTTRPRKRMEPV